MYLEPFETAEHLKFGRPFALAFWGKLGVPVIDASLRVLHLLDIATTVGIPPSAMPLRTPSCCFAAVTCGNIGMLLCSVASLLPYPTSSSITGMTRRCGMGGARWISAATLASGFASSRRRRWLRTLRLEPRRCPWSFSLFVSMLALNLLLSF